MIFKRNKALNYTFENIPLNKWIKCANGDLLGIAINGKGNVDMLDAWYKMQDDYINLFGGDTPEIKQYKRVCFEYVKALVEWIQNPKLIGKQLTIVNDLFTEKEELQKSIFKDEMSKVDFGSLIAKVTIKIRMRIERDKYTAKEFFELIKELNNGEQTN